MFLKIRKQTMDSVIGYLHTKPFNEVVGLINAISAEVNPQINPPPPKTENKAKNKKEKKK